MKKRILLFALLIPTLLFSQRVSDIDNSIKVNGHVQAETFVSAPYGYFGQIYYGQGGLMIQIDTINMVFKISGGNLEITDPTADFTINGKSIINDEYDPAKYGADETGGTDATAYFNTRCPDGDCSKVFRPSKGTYIVDGTVTFPRHSTLKIDPETDIVGSGTLTGDSTYIDAGSYNWLDTTVTITGTWVVKNWEPAWFYGGTLTGEQPNAVDSICKALNTGINVNYSKNHFKQYIKLDDQPISVTDPGAIYYKNDSLYANTTKEPHEAINIMAGGSGTGDLSQRDSLTVFATPSQISDSLDSFVAPISLDSLRQLYKGEATTVMSPASPQNGDWWRCSVDGIYTNFGNITAQAGDILSYSGSTWGLVESSDLSNYTTFDDVDDILYTTGKNLFNKTAITIGYYVNQITGNLSSSASYNATDYMPVIAGETYYRSNNSLGSAQASRYAWYDSDTVFISGVSSYDNAITAPAGAALVRYSLVVANYEEDTHQFELGAEQTTYEAFNDELLDIPDNNVSYEMLSQTLQGLVGMGRVVIPDKVYAVEGEVLQIFYKSIIEAVNYENYDIQLSISGLTDDFVFYKRYMELTPAVGDAGTYDATITINNNLGEVVTTKEFDLIISASGSLPVSQQYILTIGDSESNSGEWQKPLRDKIITDYSAATNLEWIGRIQHPTDVNINYEAYAGWTFRYFASDYINNLPTVGWTSNPFYLFDFTISAGTPVVGDVYEIGATNMWFEVLEINGAIATCRRSKVSSIGYQTAPASSGSMSLQSGTGNATAYSLLTHGLSLNKYCTANGYSGVSATGDNLTIQILLGWNELGNGRLPINHSVAISYAETLFDALIANKSSVKIVLISPNLPDQNLSGYDNSSYYSRYATNQRIWGLCEAYQELANDVTYSSCVEYIGNHDTFDSETGCLTGDTFTIKPMNKYSTINENVPDVSDWLHPSTSDYISDKVYCWMVAHLF